MQKKRIMINTFALRGGGGQTHLLKIMEYLEGTRNFSVILLVSSSTNIIVDRKDIEILKVKWPVNNPVMRFIWEILFLPYVLLNTKIDLLFCPGGVISNYVPKGIKSVTMFRNMTPFDDLALSKMPFNLIKVRNILLKRSMLKSMKKADLVIFISEFAENIIKKHLRKPLKNRILIRHGVDFSESCSTSMEISHIVDCPYIFYPSSVDCYKSQLEVVKAYASLYSKRDMPKLVLAGSLTQNLSYVKSVKKEIINNGLEDKILMVGSLDYELMPALYKNSDLVIFASQTENCPNILLEAMSSKKMILCSNFMPMPEFANDSVVYFNPKDPLDLEKKLVSVIDNKILQEEFALKALEESKKYSWGKTSKDTWDSLNSVL